MKKIYLILLILVIGIAALFYFLYPKPLKQEEQNQSPIPENNEPTQNNNSEDNLPLARARERVSKKPFAIKISPDNSPVSPEKFSGYHVGTDYEIFPEEENSDIQVFAVCDGKLLRKERISGYGGVLIQECNLENQSVTVLYGHIKISDAKQTIGQSVSEGDFLTILGSASSPDTD